MDEYPVKVGSMLYTLVDPSKGHEVAYNRWYERDHFYAGCMIGPWLFAGSRWCATRELKALRFPADDTKLLAQPYDAGSYVAIYWVHEGHDAEHWAWAGDQVVELYKEGRGFQERKHAHTVLYDYSDTVYRDPDGVPVELALDHGFAGSISIAIQTNDGVSADDWAAWVKSDAGLPALMADSNIAMGSIWTPQQGGENTGQAPMDLGMPGGGPDRSLQLLFTETDVRDNWDKVLAYAAAVEASGLARVAAAAPFHKTVVGTDTYTDQLW